MKLTSSKKSLVALSAAAAITLGGGLAFASTYSWNTTAATNDNTNPTAIAQTETFSVTGIVATTATSTLYPGNTTGAPLSVTLTNTNPYGVAVTNGVVDPGHAITASGLPGASTDCPSHATYTYASTLTVAGPSGTQGTGTVGKVTLDATTPNDCQGATFTVPLVITATQNTN